MRRLPQRQPGMFGEPVSVTIGRLAVRLLRRVPEATRPVLVDAIFAAISSPSAQLFLLQLVGNRQGIGQGMVTADHEQELAARIRARAIAMPPAELATHLVSLDLSQLLASAEDGREYLRAGCDNGPLMRALISSARGEIRNASEGCASVTTTEVLRWTWLTKLVPEGVVRQRATELVSADLEERANVSESELSTLMLAVRYATGWRPEGDPEVRAARASERTHEEPNDEAQGAMFIPAESTTSVEGE